MNFLFLSAHRLCLTTLWAVKCAMALCLKKKQCSSLNLKIILLKNAKHHLSLQQVVILSLVEGLALMLMADHGGGC